MWKWRTSFDYPLLRHALVAIFAIGFTSPTAFACSGDYYSIPAGAAQDIDECGTCKFVSNGSANPVFVPTKTNTEWTAFYTNVDANTSGAVTIGTCASTCVYPLDTVAAPAVAYSLRKLRGSYSGSLIRVRRSSDNTEQDIGVTGCGTLDTAALTTFVGAGNGYVKTWYDQSGNSRDATQSTNGSQPMIVNAGTITSKFGQSIIYFNGSTLLPGPALGLGSTNWSYSILLGTSTVVNGGSNDGAGTYYMDRTTATNNLTSIKVVGGKYALQKRNDSGGGLGTLSTTSSISTSAIQSVYIQRVYNTAYTIYLNNVSEGTLSETDGAITPPNPSIGRHATTSTGADFGIYEMIFWGSVLGSGDRTTVFQRQQSGYGF